MQCRAVRDGLLAGANYIHAGETFDAEECPRWAEPVEVIPEPEVTPEPEKPKTPRQPMKKAR